MRPFIVVVLLLLEFNNIDCVLKLHVCPNTPGAYRDIGSAQREVRSFKRSHHELPEGGIVVDICPGVYQEKLVFTEEDSGDSETRKVVYTAPSGKVLISGGVDIPQEAWVKNGSMYQVDLTKLGVTAAELGLPTTSSLGSCVHDKSELYLNGQVMILARYPNVNPTNGRYVWNRLNGASSDEHRNERLNDEYYQTARNGEGSVPAETSSTTVTINSSHVTKWVNEEEPWLHGYLTWDWWDVALKMSNFHSKGNNEWTVSLSGDVPVGKIHPDARYYGFNLFSELDAPQEYYITKSGMLYFIPPTNVTGPPKGAVVSVNDGVINITNSQFLQFDNLSIMYSKGTGVFGRNLKHVQISDCDVNGHGKNGIDIDGTHSTVEGCTVTQVGCEGISSYGGDHITLQPGNMIVTRNTVSDFSRWKRTYMPGIFWAGVNNSFTYNTISNGPHQALAGGGNVIPANYVTLEYNNIAHVTYETADSGAIYTCGQSAQGWSNRGNVIRSNTFSWVINQEPGMKQDINVIYLDDQMSGYLVENNTLQHFYRGFMIGGGRHTQVRNNYCLDGTYCLHLDNRGMGWQKSSCTPPNGDLWQGLRAVHYTQPPYSKDFPDLLNITKDHPCVPVQNVFANNEWCQTTHGMDFTAKQAADWYSYLVGNKEHCK